VLPPMFAIAREAILVPIARSLTATETLARTEVAVLLLTRVFA